MEKRALVDAIERCHAEWNITLAGLGVVGLARPGAVGHWRVRDVIAHFNGWDRWQMVQLRSAFTGEVPEESELLGGLDIAEPDPALSFVDGLNASFEAANRHRPLNAVLDDWREVCAMRAHWVADATQDQLDAIVGADWSGTPGRYIRLQSEAPDASDPKTAAQLVRDQLDHQLEHLAEVRAWMENQCVPGR